MTVYVDVLIIVNTVIDYFILLTAQRLSKTNCKIYRMVLASLLGGVLSLYIFAPDYGVAVNAVVWLLSGAMIVLSACSQNTNDKTKAGLSEHAKKYESMSYEEYRQETGNEAEFYHGNLFIGEIPESSLCVIYPGEYKEEIAASVLSNDSVPVRLQGRLDELIDGFEKETSFTEFAKSLSPDGGKEAGYELLEGGGMLRNWRLFSRPENVKYFDLGYVRLFYWYGIVPAAAYVAMCALLLRECYRRKDPFGFLMLLSFALYTTLEAHFISVYLGRNYALFLMGAYWGGILDGRKDPPKGYVWGLPAMLAGAAAKKERRG